MRQGLDVLIPALGALFAAAGAFMLFRRPHAGARALAAVMAAGAWWTLCAALEMNSGNREGAVFWSKMAAFGIAGLGPFWILFSLRYSEPDRPVSRRKWGLIWIGPILYILLVWTNHIHNWVWPQVEWIVETGRCRFGHGPAKWGMAVYSYALFLAGGRRVWATVRHSSTVYCGKALLLLVAFLFPVFPNFLYLMRWTPWPEMDVTPIAITFSVILVAFAVFRRGTLDLFPLARTLVFERMEEGVIVVDSRHQVLDLNPAAVRLMGGANCLAIGQSVGAGGREDVGGVNWKRLLTEPVTEFRTKEGRVIEGRLSPIRTEEGRSLGQLVLLRDVTAAREEARRRQEIEERLREAQKMEIVGRLAGGVAHDFNNMLQAISGFTEILLLDIPESDPKRQDLLEIQKAAARAQALTRQLLAFSRKQMLKTCLVDLNDLIRQMVKMLTRLLGEDIRIETQLTTELWPVRVDPSQIEQALLNLCVNARDAMPRGGLLTLATANKEWDEGAAAEHREELRAGRFVVVSVSDTGIGLSPEVSAHLFEPFFTTKKGRGTGMGLATLYGIVKQHGGFIHVYSEQNHGATFRLYLPAAERVDLQGDSVADGKSDSSYRGKGERILLIEDEELVRQMTDRVLRLNGYEVQPVASAAEAIRRFESDPSSWDLVFSDVVLPDGNGVDLVERFRAIHPGVAVVLASGFSDEKSRWPDIAKRNIAFLQKPWNVAELLRIMRETLSSRPAERSQNDSFSQGR